MAAKVQPTNGKLTFVTSYGSAEVVLYSKQCPVAARQFVQNCLDQYYDGSAFHKVVKGEAVFSGRRKGHDGTPRYKREDGMDRFGFRHRGMLAMTTDADGTCGAEFFITLREAPDLNGKHTILGHVVAQTIYPILNVGDVQVNTEHTPYEAPVIKRIVVDDNPFPELVARALYTKEEEKAATKKRKRKREATKNKALLSCAGEMDELDEGFDKADGVVTVFDKKVSSAHDLLEGAGLDKETTHTAERRRQIHKEQLAFEQKHGMTDAKTERLKSKISSGKRFKRQDSEGSSPPRLPSEEPEYEAPKELSAEAKAQIEELKRQQQAEREKILKFKTKAGEDVDDPDRDKPKTKGRMMLEEMKAKFQRKKAGANREKEMVLKLNAFRKTVREEKKQQPAAQPTVDATINMTAAQKEEAYLAEAPDAAWNQGPLHFSNPNASIDGSLVDDTYDVIDPLTQGGLDPSTKAAAKRLRASQHELSRKSHRVPDGYVPPDMR